MLLQALLENANEANKIARPARYYPCSNRVLKWGLFSWFCPLGMEINSL